MALAYVAFGDPDSAINPSPLALACATRTTLDVNGREVGVIIDQTKERSTGSPVADYRARSDHPGIQQHIHLLDYVVMKPSEGEELHELLTDGGRSHGWVRWCENFAFRGVKRARAIRASHTEASPAQIHAGKYQVPKGP